MRHVPELRGHLARGHRQAKIALGAAFGLAHSDREADLRGVVRCAGQSASRAFCSAPPGRRQQDKAGCADPQKPGDRNQIRDAALKR
jgi:hypothetical protein